MTAMNWDGRERFIRRCCYWSWLIPIVWIAAMMVLTWYIDVQKWMLELTYVPLWAMICPHLAYYAAISHRRCPGCTRWAWILTMMSVSTILVGTDPQTAATVAIALPLLIFSGVANLPPESSAPRSLRILVAISTALRPLALVGLSISGWVLWSTAEQGLPPGHKAVWVQGAIIALVVIFTPSGLLLTIRRRMSKDDMEACR